MMEKIKEEMTPLGRVMVSLQLKEPDRVPYVPFEMLFAAQQAGIPYSEYCKKGEAMARAEYETLMKFGYDAVNVSSDPYREASALGAKLEFIPDEVPKVVKKAIETREDYKRLEMPDPHKAWRLVERIKAVEILSKKLKDKVPVIGWIEGSFQGAWLARGADAAFFYDIKEDPDAVKELLEFFTDLELDFGKAQIDAGAQIIGCGDAIPGFCSREMFEEFAFPYEKKLFSGLKRHGAKVYHHFCGETSHVFDFAKENGCDVVQIDYPTSLRLAKEKIGDKVCIMGNIDPNRIIAQGTVEMVEKECINCIKIAGKGGGYWLSGGCENPPRDTPPENVEAIMRVVRTYGRYPLSF